MESYNPAEPPPLNIPKKLPGFSKAMAITDLVMSSLRGLAGLIALAGVVVLMKQNSPIPIWLMISESASALLVGCVGITAGIFLLREKPAGVMLGWITVGLTVVHIIVTLIGLKFQVPAGADTPTMVGVFIGGGITLLIRLGLLIAYAVGLKKAAVYFANGGSAG